MEQTAHGSGSGVKAPAQVVPPRPALPQLSSQPSPLASTGWSPTAWRSPGRKTA